MRKTLESLVERISEEKRQGKRISSNDEPKKAAAATVAIILKIVGI